MITISDSEDEELPTWGPKAPKRRAPPATSPVTSSGSTTWEGDELEILGPSKPKRQKPEGDRWELGLPCQICQRLISPQGFLAHCRQHQMIPCEICSEMLEPSELMEHMKIHKEVRGGPALDLLPCEVCGDLFMPSEYSQHLQEHEVKAPKSKMQDMMECNTPVSLAARWVEQLRCLAEPHNLFSSCIINFDLAVGFAERALRESHLLKLRDSGPEVVYHWTPYKNFKNIIDINLQVPDQKTILNQTDDGFYGAGIYTSPDFLSFRSYAYGRGGCFQCLGLPGRQYRAPDEHRDRGRPCRPNYETHTSPDRMEWVFFASDQLLPCFLVDPATQPTALELVQELEASIRKDLGLPSLKP